MLGFFSFLCSNVYHCIYKVLLLTILTTLSGNVQAIGCRLPNHTETSYSLNVKKNYKEFIHNDLKTSDKIYLMHVPSSFLRYIQVLIVYIWSLESFFLLLSNGEAVLGKWLMASVPANKWQGIFLVFHQILPPAEAPQWLLIQSLFMASDEGFQMRLRCNESDMSMWPLSWIKGVSHLA